MKKELSLMQNSPLTKVEIATFKESVINELKAGEINPLEVAIRFKGLETLLKDIQADKDFKDLAVKQADKNGKTFEYSGAKVEVAELGVKYDYSDCGDSELKQLVSQLSMIDAKIKARQEWLKSLKEPMPNEDGELCNPPSKTSTTGIKITLK